MERGVVAEQGRLGGKARKVDIGSRGRGGGGELRLEHITIFQPFPNGGLLVHSCEGGCEGL